MTCQNAGRMTMLEKGTCLQWRPLVYSDLPINESSPQSSLEKDNSLNHSCVSPRLGCLEYVPGN